LQTFQSEFERIAEKADRTKADIAEVKEEIQEEIASR